MESVHLVGRGTDLTAGGRILVDQKQALDLRVEGQADLSFVGDFAPDVVAHGTVVTNATIRGSFSDPQVLGRMEFQKASFNIVDIPNGISNATGSIAFNKDRATIQNLTGETGGGKIDLSGFVQYAGGGPIVFRLHAQAREVRVRYPEGVSTLANASLILTGTETASTLSGTITILRTGINLQSDFSSLLAKSAEPVRTPSAPQGLLGGMSFDVQVQTAPETQFESSLTEGIQAEANLRLRGTVTNPAVIGRVTITQGKLTFFGTQYTVNQGTVNFYNPVKVDPILNVDLETKARGIDITLTVSGPLNKLTLTPRSDPPLQFSEIVALLAQGRTPTSDPALMRAAERGPADVSAGGRVGAARLRHRQSGGRKTAALLRREQAAHRSLALRRGEQPPGAAHPGATGDAEHYLYLHHQRHQQQPAGRADGVGHLQTMVGGWASRRERPCGHRFLLQEAIQVAADDANKNKARPRLFLIGVRRRSIE